jgi:hypothetical protein
MRAIGLQSPSPPSSQATSQTALGNLWLEAGFEEIETRAIDIPVEFADFEEFWQSMTLPVGPAGKAIVALSPDDRAQLRSVLEQQVPLTSGGRVVYKAHASAIKGRRAG